MAQHQLLLLVLVLLSAFVTSQPVIDIFTNYPNTAQVLEDYNAILSKRAEERGRHLDLYDYNKDNTQRRSFYKHEDNNLGTIDVPDHLESEFGVFTEMDDPAMTSNHHNPGLLGVVQRPPHWNFSDRFEFDVTNNVGQPGDISLESDFGEFITVHRPRRKKIKASVAKVTQPPTTSTPDVPPSKLNVTNIVRKYLIRMHKRKKLTNATRKNRKQSITDFDHSSIDGSTVNRRLVNSITDGVSLDSEDKFISDTYTAPFETIKNKTKHYASKLLSLFTVVQFSNSRCQATSASSQYEGTCYLASECAERNGIEMGACAQGHGVCCVFRSTCGSSAANNCSYFESPGYPNYFPGNGGIVLPTRAPPTVSPPLLTPDPRIREVADAQNVESDALSCIFQVLKANSSIRQMRIDFIDLELTGPSNGTCSNERLMITGTGLTMRVPIICGYNTGQHVYVDVSSMTGPLQLAVLANTIMRKRYKIRICQYTAGCDGLNCLQQFAGRSGVITSFNYEEAATFSRSMPGYLNNLNYAICIRRLPGFCSITYSNIAPDGVVYPFELRNVENGMLTVPTGQAGVGVMNCPDDYIVIDGLRLCGDRLNDGSTNGNFSRNAPVTDTSGGPILLPVRTSSMTNARGFKLFYMQNPCPAGGGGPTPDPRFSNS